MSYKRNSKYDYSPVKRGLAPRSLFASRNKKPQVTGSAIKYDYAPQRGMPRAGDSGVGIRHRFVSVSIAAVGLSLIWSLNQSDASYAPLTDNEAKAFISVHDAPARPDKQQETAAVLQALAQPPVTEAPVQLTTAAAQSVALPAQEAVAATAEEPEESEEPNNSWLTLTVEAGDNLSLLFERNQLSHSELHQILKLGKSVKILERLHPGQQIRVLTDADKQIQSLQMELGVGRELRVERQLQEAATAFAAEVFEHDFERKLSHVSGDINSSLRVDGYKAGMSRAVIREFIELFKDELDFTLDVKKGDRFAVVFEDYYFQNKRAKTGAIFAAEYTSDDKTLRLLRYEDKDGAVHYYTPEGQSLRRAFLRKPLSRGIFTSGFNLKRRHPILKTVRPHKGIDYSAPTGTKIYAASSGKIAFIGRKGGYGRTVEIQHGDDYKTLYAHLSRYPKDLKKGQRVKQGQVIGYVGSSGLATGAHLHFEVHKDGVAKNPLSVKLPRTQAILAEEKSAFLAQTRPWLAMLESGDTQLAQAPSDTAVQ